MASAPQTQREVIGYRRSLALPGIVGVDARDSPREWRVIEQDYAVVVFKTWRGQVRNSGRVHTGAPGMAFCMLPGDSMIARPESFGSFNVLEFQSDVLEEWFTEQQPSSRRWAWAEVMRPVSTQLRQQFASFCDAIDPLASALELQSRSVDLSQIMIRELIAGASDRVPIDAPVIRGAARMRECLNEEGPDIDLDTLAQRAGLSRFQALRAFKRRYGLPPHAYQICLRISHARQMLVDGAPAVDVAAHCGFADQSHLNRHFKRLLGVTPMQYARSHRELRRSERDPDLVIARSDH